MGLRRTYLMALPLMLLAAISAQAQQQSASARGWQQLQNGDAGRDSSSTQFALAGKFLTKPKGDTVTPPTLVVACKARRSHGRFSSGTLNAGVALNIEYVEPNEIKAGTSYYPKVSTRYRLDDAKEEKEMWAAGADKASATFTKSELEKMLRAHTVEITVQEFHASDISIQFDMPDSAKLEDACGLRVPAKK